MNKKLYFLLKRLFDIAVSLVMLIVLSPVWLIAVAGIEISDAGSVFYMAKRVGKDNRVFRMFKFRSMRVDRSADEKSLRPDADRIFPWGKFMRDTKIDELPQLINILLGDMSFVGPRPAAVDQIDITRGGENAAAAKLVPGLTGPSALYDFIYGDRFEDEAEYIVKVLPTRLKLDLYYLRAGSVGYDLKMIWYTFICVVCAFLKKEPKRIHEELLKNAEEC